MFFSQARTRENKLSIGLVECNVLRSSAGTFNRCKVSSSLKASNNESAADSLIARSHCSNSRSSFSASL